MGKKVNITLTVSASALYNANPQPTTPSQLNPYCSLSDDNNGSSSDGTPENFQSNVYINNDVKWDGNTNDSGYSIAIESVSYESVNNDTNFFPTIILGGTGGRNGTVTSKVNNNQSLAGKLDVYQITFRVYAQGNNYLTYSIDPKLSGNN